MASDITFPQELRIATRIAGIRLRGQMAYRGSFVMQLLSNFLVHAAEVLAMFAMFYRFDNLGGWTLGDVAFLHGVSMIAFGVGDLLTVGMDRVAPQIREGEFDRTMLRPMSTWMNSAVSDFSLRHIGQVMQGILVFAWSLTAIETTWSASRALVLLIMLVSGIVLYMALFTIEAILAFWTTNGVEAVNAFTYGGSDLAEFPLHIYGRFLRFLFLWIIPIGFISYLPSLYILDKDDPLNLPFALQFIGPVFVLLFVAVVSWGWNQGIRHYRSTGS